MSQYSLNVSKVVQIGTDKLFQLTDPTDGAGTELPRFSLYQVYPVERSKAEVICQRLYKQVFEKINTGSLGDSKALLIKYVEMNDERIYIVVTRETPRNTHATIFMRFHGYGDHLYVGIDAYVLGRIKWSAVLWRLFICLAGLILLLLATAISRSFVSSYGVSYSRTPDMSGWWLAFGIFFVGCWWEVIKRAIQNPKTPLSVAFRQVFQGSLNLGSFNIDDVMMFLKSTLSVGVIAVRDIFKDEGLPVEILDAFVQNINVSNVFESSVGAVVGNVQGDFITNPSSQKR
ncbi:hypothetical protein [Coleofasciculus sp. H7-2]|uniref:hypothetical protein n=1 Tax=Coleofasciculus sp. H7-2 TaxID=3351545 RepID=UPI00366E7020